MSIFTAMSSSLLALLENCTPGSVCSVLLPNFPSVYEGIITSDLPLFLLHVGVIPRDVAETLINVRQQFGALLTRVKDSAHMSPAVCISVRGFDDFMRSSSAPLCARVLRHLVCDAGNWAVSSHRAVLLIVSTAGASLPEACEKAFSLRIDFSDAVRVSDGFALSYAHTEAVASVRALFPHLLISENLVSSGQESRTSHSMPPAAAHDCSDSAPTRTALALASFASSIPAVRFTRDYGHTLHPVDYSPELLSDRRTKEISVASSPRILHSYGTPRLPQTVYESVEDAHRDIIRSVLGVIRADSFGHVLLHGPSGCGKTAVLRLIASHAVSKHICSGVTFIFMQDILRSGVGESEDILSRIFSDPSSPPPNNICQLLIFDDIDYLFPATARNMTADLLSKTWDSLLLVFKSCLESARKSRSICVLATAATEQSVREELLHSSCLSIRLRL